MEDFIKDGWTPNCISQSARICCRPYWWRSNILYSLLECSQLCPYINYNVMQYAAISALWRMSSCSRLSTTLYISFMVTFPLNPPESCSLTHFYATRWNDQPEVWGHKITPTHLSWIAPFTDTEHILKTLSYLFYSQDSELTYISRANCLTRSKM